MYACVAADLESNGRSGSNINSEMLQEKFDDSSQYDIKFRCLCESPLLAGPMVWCQDPQCHVWQHTGCVIIPEEPMEGVSPVPPQYYCESCRISRADPFWVTVAHPLYPVKLTASSIPIDGMNPGQNVEKLFHLTRADRDLLQKTEYDVQVWCILLNDKVPFRMHWPQHADLQVNGVAVQTINRPGSQLLGTNGRDDGPLIKACISDGVNKISFRRCDARIFCLGVRIVKRQTIQQVLDLIPMESDGERFEDALARVWRCIGGGVGTENADSDSDLEVVADLVPVNLCCPMSGSRMKIAGRFKPCVHMGCFDLETFVELNQRSKKWQCPICLKNYSLENIIIDPYFNRITAMMRYCGEDVTEIEVKPDGSWRVKNKNVQRDLAQWHFPDGTARVAADEVSLNLETLKQLKQESVSERHTGLKLGIDKNYDGFRDINKPEDACTHFPANILRQMFDNNSQNFIPMSSSATGSGREGENPSVKQEGCGHFDLSANIGIKLDSVSLNFYPTRGAAKYPSAPVGNAEIIVLSDSEEENENLIPPGTVYDTGQADASLTNFCVPHPGVSDSYSEDPGLTAEGSSCLRLFNSNGSGEFAMSPWPLPSVPQAGSGFQLFGSEVNVSNAYVQYSSVTCPSPVNGYSLAPEIAMGSSMQMPDSSCYISESLINNSLPFCGHDSSLQNFLPTKPGGSSEQSDLKDQPDISNGIHTEDWVSLSLGGGGCSSGGFGDSAAEIGFNSRNWFAPVEDGMESSANTASLLSSVNDDIIDWTTTTREMDDTSLFFPHPPTNWKRDYNPSYCPSPPQSVRTLFNRTTSNKDGDDKTKMIPPLGNTASLLSSVNDGMFYRTTMKRENNDISFYCPRPPTDQERDANPGHFPSLRGL